MRREIAKAGAQGDVAQETESRKGLPPAEKRSSSSVREPPSSAPQQLLERAKELACLFGISELALHSGRSLDTVLHGVANLLPASLQHAREARARIEFEGRQYCSAGGERMNAQMAAPILLESKLVGRVIVGYEGVPVPSEGAFLREEQRLVVSVANHIGLVIGRTRAELLLEATNRQLEQERQALMDANAALRALMERVQDEKQAIARTIRSNLEDTVEPLLDSLQRDLPHQRTRIELLRQCLGDIVSPFLQVLQKRSPNLTPSEQAICVMIRGGRTTKEIAQLRKVAVGTISRHRENIRKKLGLQNEDKNLVTYLSTLDLD